MARDFNPLMVSLVEQNINLLNIKDRDTARYALNIMQGWLGDMGEDSISASVYSFWQLKFYQSLLNDGIEDDNVRLAITGNYPFGDFFKRMILALQEDPENVNFNRVCKNGYRDYQGPKPCIYNLANALV
jgi:acyl-homoserine lactone acylase PvdQ